MIKRYLVFCFKDYYSKGGIRDLLDSSETLKEAKEIAVSARTDCANILDIQTGERYYCRRSFHNGKLYSKWSDE